MADQEQDHEVRFGRNNEVCGACDWEGEVLVFASGGQVYEWDCPDCGYQHTTTNDDDVWTEMLDSWTTDHVADMDSDGDTYKHMALIHKQPVAEDADPVAAHSRKHGLGWED